MTVLPAYVWPPLSWVARAHAAHRFQVAYPARLPKGSYFARYSLQPGQWLSIPLHRPSRKSPPEATWPAESRWRLYHWRTLLTHFGKAPFFYEWKPFLEYLYLEAPVRTLREFTDLILQELARLYGWQYMWAAPERLSCVEPETEELSLLVRLLRVGT